LSVQVACTDAANASASVPLSGDQLLQAEQTTALTLFKHYMKTENGEHVRPTIKESFVWQHCIRKW